MGDSVTEQYGVRQRKGRKGDEERGRGKGGGEEGEGGGGGGGGVSVDVGGGAGGRDSFSCFLLLLHIFPGRILYF